MIRYPYVSLESLHIQLNVQSPFLLRKCNKVLKTVGKLQSISPVPSGGDVPAYKRDVLHCVVTMVRWNEIQRYNVGERIGDFKLYHIMYGFFWAENSFSLILA